MDALFFSIYVDCAISFDCEKDGWGKNDYKGNGEAKNDFIGIFVSSNFILAMATIIL